MRLVFIVFGGGLGFRDLVVWFLPLEFGGFSYTDVTCAFCGVGRGLWVGTCLLILLWVCCNTGF